MKVVHCKKEPYDVYIGRPSKWGNPFVLNKGESRGATIERYEEWLASRIDSGSITAEELMQLDGKTLGCWCKPYPCHGDVLIKAVEWAKTQIGDNDED